MTKFCLVSKIATYICIKSVTSYTVNFFCMIPSSVVPKMEGFRPWSNKRKTTGSTEIISFTSSNNLVLSKLVTLQFSLCKRL